MPSDEKGGPATCVTGTEGYTRGKRGDERGYLKVKNARYMVDDLQVTKS